MNFTDTLQSVELVLAAGEVPLLVGETGIGKTALAKKLAEQKKWSLIVIDGNLLKEGEIGGLPTIESYTKRLPNGEQQEIKTTVYAVHHKLRELDKAVAEGNTVLLFIDEINRCEHTVQQELMNLILNREINGYTLPAKVNIIAAMNPSNKYGSPFDYQVVDMDKAQENRFVWLYMEPDYLQWLDWAMEAEVDPKVIDFIAAFPEYLHRQNEEDIQATPRSYERISRLYALYKKQQGTVPKSVFFNVIRGNVGNFIAQEFVHFAEADYPPLVSFSEVFAEESIAPSVVKRLQAESHTRLYLTGKNLLKQLETAIQNNNPTPNPFINRLLEVLNLFPVDLRIAMMKEMRSSYPQVYAQAIEQEAFVEMYFAAYGSLR